MQSVTMRCVLFLYDLHLCSPALFPLLLIGT